MSRTFLLENGDNRLSATGTAESTAEITQFGWVKEAGTEPVDRAPFSFSAANKRRWVNFRGSQSYIVQFADDNGYLRDDSESRAQGVWRSVALRCTDAGSGDFTWDLFLDGVLRNSRTLTVAALMDTDVLTSLGASTTGSVQFNGKLAHSATWLRPLTNTELTNLHSGTNPSSIDSAGQFAYYPMTDNSLVNAWADTPGSALAVNGTVPNDDADNPTVSAPVLPASVTTSDTLQPGTEFTLTAANYASAPVSPVTLTDSEGSTITVPVTISGSGPYTAVGTMPTLAEAVTAGTSLLFGDVTIELST